MDRPPPFQHALDTPSPHLTCKEISKLVCHDLIQLDSKNTWMQSITNLGPKMAHYKEHFLQLLDDGFVIRPRYMDMHLSHGLRCINSQMRTSSHQLEIEIGRLKGVLAKDRICQLCQRETEIELHFICHCPIYYEIRGRFHYLFKSFGPLPKVMNFQDQQCLGLYLSKAHKHRESLFFFPKKDPIISNEKITQWATLPLGDEKSCIRGT